MTTCAICGSANPTAQKFCGECGAALGNRCARCGAENGAGKKFCGDCGTPLAPANDELQRDGLSASHLAGAAEGERRQLTVMFCDLVGSTPLSQQLDAEEWRDIIAQYQAAASGAVARWGGHVARLLGDGLLIYFGWPTAREDDPERAVRAGLAIVDAVRVVDVAALKDRSSPATGNAPTPNALSVRIGMHTGPVVIADDGEVFGETPNLAARVQGAAEPNAVVITSATQRLVVGMFVVEDRGPQVLKGVRDPMRLYRVMQPSGVRSRLDVAAGRLTRFVGREVELATLVDRWERAQDGEGQNVLVVGEAGVGKSRLVYQLRERLAALPHTWLECGATPYTAGTPFHPVIALVARGLALSLDDTVEEKLAKLRGGMGELASGETMALLADFLGLPAPTPLAMSPDLQRRKTIDLLAHWNLVMSEAQPLVILIEDLHWCDASSLELLGRLIAQSPTARVLLLATARPEFRPPWPARSNMTTLPLARLTKRQARDMVAALGGTKLPADTLDALVARADGVPLYVEELTKSLVEPGAAPGVEAIPATLADSLMARLDRLSTAKEVAQRAAVLGREFSYPLLAAMSGLDETVLRQGLARLIAAEIVFARGEPPQSTYTFKHALVQEAAHGSLLKRRRQQFHGRVVDVLVASFPAQVAAEPEVVARHAEAAGRIDDAIAYYQRAGEHAQARSAHAESIRHLRQAIALLSKQPRSGTRDAREVALQLALGGSLVVARGYAHPEVEAVYERARVLCESVGDAGRLGLALIGLVAFYYSRGEVERGRVLAARVLAAAEQSGDTELLLHGHLQLAIPEYYQGKFASSLADCEAARSLYDRGRHHAVVSMLAGDPGVVTLAYAAWNLWALGWPDRALASAREAVMLARQLGHPFSLAQALFYETAVHWLRRDVTAQRARAAETIALSEAQGFPLWLGVGRAFHAAARVAGGEPAAVPDLLAGLALAADTGSQAGAPALSDLVGAAYLAAGQLDEARDAVDTGLTLALKTGQPFFVADLHRLQGELALAGGGAAADAGAFFHRAVDVACAQEAKSFELRVRTNLARLRRDQGQRVEARDLLAPLYASFGEGFDTCDLIDAKALLEEVGQPPGATAQEQAQRSRV